MVLYVIGLGLGDETDITVRGLNAIKTCDKVFLENYTSILGIDHKLLTEYYGREVILADRECVESGAEVIYEQAKDKNIAFLVVGDPFCATTHTDLILRAQEIGARVEVIHNASVMGAAGACGLQLYHYGQTVSIPFFTEGWRPDSFYDKVAFNRKGGLHTLCLLDIKVKEPDFEAMARGRTVYLPPRFMTVNEALEQLLEIEDRRQENVYSRDTMCVGMARLGQPTQCIVAGTMQELLTVDFGGPLHCLAIAGDVHILEQEMLDHFSVANWNARQAAIQN
ncbi:diphthine synthase [Saprolegnia diclina VS20]|uniref:diphthine methyl ester synthase n=2 Tax=Saprolegnia TaxID=4769 RepID=T0PY96_SAPDV|nr:diphthine synthase [Saprolegnia diclina VS20]EQC30504.1 diphthine synthase [Saprolegnia diclina VS20]|eukprot:XP_008616097.1 diphthine synthase [Saprolegnia diclina VS20]